MDTYDGLVIGSGHNGLICAGYLARAGMKVLVVDRNDRVGGGCLTEEATLPGFLHNLHANFFMGIDLTPYVRDLELERHGFELIFPPVQHGIAFPDGTGLCIHQDPEKTAASIARFSRKDADRFREIHAKYTVGMRSFITSVMFNPPLPPEEMAARLNGELGEELKSYNGMTMYEAVEKNFEEPHVRTLFKLWFHILSLENDPGTGAFFPRVFSRMDRFAVCKGGAVRFTNALAESLKAHGGEILTGAHVSAITHENGRATGLRLDDGRTLRANRVVVSTVDPPQTLRMVGDEAFGPAISEKLRGFKPSPHVICTLHLALNEPPKYAAAEFEPDLDRSYNTFLGVADEAHLAENFEATMRGEFPPFPMGNGACNTRFDPSCAPPGKHVAFWWPFVPYDLKDGGPEAWDAKREEFTRRLWEVWRAYAPNLDENNVLGTYLFTPLDTERSCINMIRGSHHVGAYTPDQVGYNRPTPELSHYRTPVEGLYLAGSGSHVGGSINGAAGYNAANVIAEDLEIEKWWTPVPQPVLA
ncbi:MAG: phytoene desaturase family protein [Nitrospinota bacterium]